MSNDADNPRLGDADPFVPAFQPERCAEYLAGTEGSNPRPQLIAAIALMRATTVRTALDIGCGPGREALAMLRAGLRVTAVDPYRVMLDRTRELIDRNAPDRAHALELHHGTIEDFAPRLASAGFGLVHAGFVLPFVIRERFDGVFGAIERCLAPEGVLAAQFFGPDDEFIRGATGGTMTAHTASDLDALLSGFEVLSREEHNRAGTIGRGRAKWWHVHHVIARKRSPPAGPGDAPAAID